MVSLEQTLGSTQNPSFTQDTMNPSLSAPFGHSMNPFPMGFGNTGADVPLVSPQKAKRDLDSTVPLLRQLESFTNNATTSADGLRAFSGASQPMFGAPSMTVRPSAVTADAGKASHLHPTQLGGTAWLGLGGSTHLTGDAGGGGEFNLLSEFLESLDDGAGVHSDDLMLMPKTEPNLSMNGSLLHRLPTEALLDTPSSMAAPDPNAPLPVTDAASLSMLEPHSSMRLGNNNTQRPRRHSVGDATAQKPDAGSESMEERYVAMAASAPQIPPPPPSEEQRHAPPYPPSLSKTASKTERFLLTAADQTDGSRDERLRKVIQAKWEAGLLRPYNHVHGYTRLNRWMENNVSASSRRRILKPLSVFQPVFSSLAKNLTNYDLIYIEEAFERLLLDYDRVFSIQGIPACLWRRTGEIYKGNKEFAELVGMPIDSLRDGRLCIYELMAEESAVNYWEKYGSVSFDPSQKAVLTMCKLKTKNRALARATASAQATEDRANGSAQGNQAGEGESEHSPASTEETTKHTPACISCCFSFTIRRDKWNPLQAATNTLGSRKRARDMATMFDKRPSSQARTTTPVAQAPLSSVPPSRAPAQARPAPPIAQPRAPMPEPSRPQTRLEREKKRHYNDPPNVGPWKLGKLIGQGASGRVRLAMHSRTQQMAAVKIIPKQMLINSRMSLRDLSAKQDKLTLGIEREIVIMKLIEHPNLLGLWDVYETSKELFLVMEYVAGGELFDFLVARGRLPPNEARMYFRQIIFGVDYCHTFSICHRDLKPENLLLDGTRTTVKIADFGMAALQTTEKMLETSCGSPHYASPEIVSGRSYDGTASDIWSCGIILFALLCGRLPFDDPNIQVLLGKVRSGKFAMPNHLEPGVRDLISRMLQADPKKRATMREICAHPWFTDNGRLSSENPVSTEVSALSNEPVNLADIDPDILGNLSTLWPELSHEQIIRRLLEPGPNWQKTFYSLLVIHRDTYGTDDEDEDLEELDEDDNLALKQKREEDQKRAASPPLPTQLLPAALAAPQVKTQLTSPKVQPPIVPAAMGSAPINNSLGLVVDARKASGSARDSLTERQPGPVSAPVGVPAPASSMSTPPSAKLPPGVTKTEAGPSAPVSKMEQMTSPAPPTPPKDSSVSAVPGNSAAAWLMEQTKVEQIRAERMRAEVAKAEQALAEREKQEQLKAEQARAEQARAEQAKAEQARAEQAKAEQAKAEQARAEQAKAEQAKAEQTRAEQARAEQAKAEQAKAEQTRAEQARAEQAKAEQARAEQAKAEQAKAEQAKAEQAKAEQAKAEQAKAEQARAEQARAAQADQAKTLPTRPQSREDGRPNGSGRRLSSFFNTRPFAGRKASLPMLRSSSATQQEASRSSSTSAAASTPSSRNVSPAPTQGRVSMKASSLAYTDRPVSPVTQPAPKPAPVSQKRPVPAVPAAPAPAEVSKSTEMTDTSSTIIRITPTTKAASPMPSLPVPPVVTVQSPSVSLVDSSEREKRAPVPVQEHSPVQSSPAAPSSWTQRLPSLQQATPSKRNVSQTSEGDHSLMRMFMREIADELDSLDAMDDALAMPNYGTQRTRSGAAQPPSVSVSREQAPNMETDSDTKDESLPMPQPLVVSESSMPQESLDESSLSSVNRYEDADESSLLVASVDAAAPAPGQPRARVPTPVYAAFAKYSAPAKPRPSEPLMRASRPAMRPRMSEPLTRRRSTEGRAFQPGMPQVPQPMGARDMPTVKTAQPMEGASQPQSPPVQQRPVSTPSNAQPPSPDVARRPASAMGMEGPQARLPTTVPAMVSAQSPVPATTLPRVTPQSPATRPQSPVAGVSQLPPLSSLTPKVGASPVPGAASRGAKSPTLGGTPTMRTPQSPTPTATNKVGASVSPRVGSQRAASGSSSRPSLRPRRSLMGVLRGGNDEEPTGLGLDIVGIEKEAAHVPRPTSPISGDAPSLGARHSWFHTLLPRRQMHVLMSVENLTVTVEQSRQLLQQLGSTPTHATRTQMTLPVTQQGALQYLLEELVDPSTKARTKCKPMRFRVEYTILPVRSQPGRVASGSASTAAPSAPLSPGMPGFDPRAARRPVSPALGGASPVLPSLGEASPSPSFATSVTFTHERGSLSTFRVLMDKLHHAWTMDTAS
ncbi:Transcription factor [Malassezia caprae]|uniref:non-specific serine/threonine protein kinase n=1 Tax=Malassezia caprae TaxID=1381934 RepID=A0AAF0E7W0_9BASI|nr:Transcription factor [Malassezia caprae]